MRWPIELSQAINSSLEAKDSNPMISSMCSSSRGLLNYQ